MKQDTWIPAGIAAKILSERFGRPVRVDYVTKLGSLNRIRTQHIGSRMVLYNRNDIEQIQIKFRAPVPNTKHTGEKSTESSQSEEVLV